MYLSNEQEKANLYAMIDLADNAILQGDKKQALTSLYFIKTGLENILKDNDNLKVE
ncbi:hypothetical protein [Streptococcus anginosus]|uniref:hypothetical protein n=1 Tax=Streptococcus anginosus TaxID=1328 RepID=UPI0015F346A8|nr:hypothetical protein [Streptococcus anginosus]